MVRDVPKGSIVFILGVEYHKENNDLFLDFLTQNINTLWST